MTETRKAIIELIEPYMDKTLSEGCLIECDYEVNNGNDSMSDIIIFRDGDIFEEIIDGCYNWNIIGHYDITAVFYYIWKKKSDFTLKAEWEWRGSTPFNMSISYRSYWSDHIYKKHLPNKPLYLYNEQEEKELLDLLLKIK